MLQKTDNFAIELKRPHRDLIIRPSLFNWKLNEELEFIPSIDEVRSMSMERLRNLRLASISSAKGFDELSFLSFTFDDERQFIHTTVTEGGHAKSMEAANPFQEPLKLQITPVPKDIHIDAIEVRSFFRHGSWWPCALSLKG